MRNLFKNCFKVKKLEIIDFIDIINFKFPIPRQGTSFAKASLYLGWETAYTKGFRTEASLAKIKSHMIYIILCIQIKKN